MSWSLPSIAPPHFSLHPCGLSLPPARSWQGHQLARRVLSMWLFYVSCLWSLTPTAELLSLPQQRQHGEGKKILFSCNVAVAPPP